MKAAITCGYWGCPRPSQWCETVKVTPNGMPSSLAFYYSCDIHKPIPSRNTVSIRKVDPK